MKNLKYGIRDIIPDDAVAAWGARAILKNGNVDLVPDRGDYFGEDEPWDSFGDWVNSVAMAWLEKQAEAIRGNENNLHSLDDGCFHIRCNAQASHGYLYVTAWMDKE